MTKWNRIALKALAAPLIVTVVALRAFGGAR